MSFAISDASRATAMPRRGALATRTAVMAGAAALATVAIAVTVACGSRHHDPIVATGAGSAGATRMIGFDDQPLGKAPTGFLCTAVGPDNAKPAHWQVVAAADAPSPKQVLEQSDNDDTNNRFPVALVEGEQHGDVRVSVHAKAVSGGRDRSFGVVVRAKDERNYYVARANSSVWGENVRFYKFIDGKRSQLDEWEGPVPPGVWHVLQVEAVGDLFTITLDGKAILQLHDATLPAPGLVGVWTKSESVSQFDDLSITPLAAPAAPAASPSPAAKGP